MVRGCRVAVVLLLCLVLLLLPDVVVVAAASFDILLHKEHPPSSYLSSTPLSSQQPPQQSKKNFRAEDILRGNSLRPSLQQQSTGDNIKKYYDQFARKYHNNYHHNNHHHQNRVYEGRYQENRNGKKKEEFYNPNENPLFGEGKRGLAELRFDLREERIHSEASENRQQKQQRQQQLQNQSPQKNLINLLSGDKFHGKNSPIDTSFEEGAEEFSVTDSTNLVIGKPLKPRRKEEQSQLVYEDPIDSQYPHRKEGRRRKPKPQNTRPPSSLKKNIFARGKHRLQEQDKKDLKIVINKKYRRKHSNVSMPENFHHTLKNTKSPPYPCEIKTIGQAAHRTISIARQCHEQESPPSCCNCSETERLKKVSFANVDGYTFITDNRTSELDSMDCDSLVRLVSKKKTLNVCERLKDQNCCSSIKNLGELKDMVTVLDEPEKIPDANNEHDNSSIPEATVSSELLTNKFLPLNETETGPSEEKEQCLRLTNNNCTSSFSFSSSSSDLGGDQLVKKACLTSDSFPKDQSQCCLINHRELFQFSLQKCKKFPILRVLWPRAFEESEDGCQTGSSTLCKENNLPLEIENGLLKVSETGDSHSDVSRHANATYGAKKDTCVQRSALRHLLERDTFIGQVLEQHKRIFQRIDCSPPFSVNCSACQVR